MAVRPLRVLAALSLFATCRVTSGGATAAGAGHCAFTPAETIAAFNTLVDRIQRGHWSGVSASELNADAAELGPGLNVFVVDRQIVPTPAAFLESKPTRFPRPFSLQDAG